MTEAGWTREKPKGPGFYWYRATPDVFPRIANISRNAAHFTSGKCVGIDDLHGEWLGPITHTDRQQGRVEGLREAEKYALRCLKELQDKIRDLESGKCVLAGAQTKEGVEAWVHAKTLEASRIAKWITARIIEQQAQDEKGVRDGK